MQLSVISVSLLLHNILFLLKIVSNLFLLVVSYNLKFQNNSKVPIRLCKYANGRNNKIIPLFFISGFYKSDKGIVDGSLLSVSLHTILITYL